MCTWLPAGGEEAISSNTGTCDFVLGRDRAQRDGGVPGIRLHAIDRQEREQGIDMGQRMEAQLPKAGDRGRPRFRLVEQGGRDLGEALHALLRVLLGVEVPHVQDQHPAGRRAQRLAVAREVCPHRVPRRGVSSPRPSQGFHREAPLARVLAHEELEQQLCRAGRMSHAQGCVLA